MTLEDLMRQHEPKQRQLLIAAARDAITKAAAMPVDPFPLFTALFELASNAAIDVECERLLEQRKVTEAFVEMVTPLHDELRIMHRRALGQPDEEVGG